jgi:hypothetical protein
MGLDLLSGGLVPVFVSQLDPRTEGMYGKSLCRITDTFDPPTLKLYCVTNPCLMSSKGSEYVRHMIGQTKENVSQEAELLCNCPGNEERRLEACSTELGLYIFLFQLFQ